MFDLLRWVGHPVDNRKFVPWQVQEDKNNAMMIDDKNKNIIEIKIYMYIYIYVCIIYIYIDR